MKALSGWRAPARVLLTTSSLLACDAGGPRADGDTCEIDRDCQDGDVCNGAERCAAGVCAPAGPGEGVDACIAREPACGGACADDERCQGTMCERVCLPPTAPVWSQVPVGTALLFPAEARVVVDAAGSSISLGEPATPDDPGAHLGVTFTRPGPVAIEARWDVPEVGCEAATFRASYEVVGAVVADPTAAPDAIALDDPRIYQWAAGWDAPDWGSDVDPAWQDPTRALGPATGAWDDATSLGNGGALTLVFEVPIADGPGPDLAVFENGFSERFLELAWVEVSSDGHDFVRFASLSTQGEAVGAYGTLDASEVVGLAGRFRAGLGVTFDLATLAQTSEVLTGRVDLSAVTHVRVVDVVGDGTSLDALGHPIYDPTPTFGSAGFDLEAVGAIAAP